MLTKKVNDMSDRMMEMRDDFTTQLQQHTVRQQEAMQRQQQATDDKFSSVLATFSAQLQMAFGVNPMQGALQGMVTGPMAITGGENFSKASPPLPPPALAVSVAMPLESAASSYGPMSRNTNSLTGPYGVREVAPEPQEIIDGEERKEGVPEKDGTDE